MFNKYYQEELSNLRELAVEFSKAHPALAPMLAGSSPDPDVERLLEGVAFLTGLLRQKLDDEFPEIIQGLMHLIFPHYLRPVPGASVVVFTPKPNLKQVFNIPAGTELASIPAEGTKCLFNTCYEVEACPLRLAEAALNQSPGQPPTINLVFEMTGMDLESWEADKLRFHLGGDYTTAANLYMLLRHYLKNITILSSEGGGAIQLDSDYLKPVGFSDDEEMLEYPAQSFSGYRLLQEYFIMPEKFLFLEVHGLNKWKNRGTGSRFRIIFELNELPFAAPPISTNNFLLFATPVINLFRHDAEPVLLDHKKTAYKVFPGGSNKNHFQVYSVESVEGAQRGVAKARKYEPFELFSSQHHDQPIYHISHKRSNIGNLIDAMISFTYPEEKKLPTTETLSIILKCTNGELVDKIQVGDITQSTATSPELLSFTNIRPPTSSVLPPLGKDILWRFLSLYSLNCLPLANSENIKALLNLYLFTESRDKASIYANQRRIDGITNIKVSPADKLVRGYMMRGQDIELDLRGDHFANDGDMFLFGTVLDEFFSSYANINSFTQFRLEEKIKGDSFKWPARIGNRSLI
jgi:type VI secretion system protein ImpG